MGNGASADGGDDPQARGEGDAAEKSGGGFSILGGAKAQVTGFAGEMLKSASGFVDKHLADNARRARCAEESGGLVSFFSERVLPAVLPPVAQGPAGVSVESGGGGAGWLAQLSQQGSLADMWANKDKLAQEMLFAKLEADAKKQQEKEELALLRIEQHAERSHLCDEEESSREYYGDCEEHEWLSIEEYREQCVATAHAESAAVFEEQRAGVIASEASQRGRIDEQAVHGVNALRTTCQCDAAQIAKRAAEKAAKAEEARVAAAKRKAEAAQKEAERNRVDAERKQRQEEAARIAAAKTPEERRKAEAAARAAEKKRREAEKQRKEEVAAQQRAERRAAEEAKRKAEAKKKAEEEAKRKEAEAKRRKDEAARIAAAKEDAERRRLEAEAAAEQARREEAAKRRRREEELAAQLAAANALEDDDSDSSDEDPALPAEPKMEGTRYTLFENEPDTWRIVAGEGTKDEKWGFFNNMREWVVVAEVAFSKKSKMKPLGATTTKKKPNGSTAFSLRVYPGETAEFAQGEVDDWSGGFDCDGIDNKYLAQVAADRASCIEDTLAKMKAMNIDDENNRIAACVVQRIRYIDPNFPPKNVSLLGTRGQDTAHGPDDVMETTPWSTPAVYLPQGVKPRLIKGGILADDIDQGGLGDCWFLASIACLAEFPCLVKSLLRPPIGLPVSVKKERKFGVYRVWLCKSGWWKNWVVDEYLPGASARRFASNKEEPAELWVSMIEKAYAKAHDGFANIIGGYGSLALHDLTGFPTICWTEDMANNPDKCFANLCTWDAQGYLMWTATASNEKKCSKAGLVAGHAYSLIAATEVAGRQLLRLRNPWGKKEWKGDWCDGHALWKKHPEVAKACGYNPNAAVDDGTFWMNWDDFRSHMDCGTTCFVKPSWADLRVKVPVRRRRGTVCMCLHVKAPIDVFLTMWQPCSREESTDYKTKPHLLMLAEGRKRPNARVPQYTYVAFNQKDPAKPTKKPVHSFEQLMIARRLSPTNPDTPYFVCFKVWDDRDSDGEWTNVLGIASDKPVGAAFTVEFRTVPHDHDAYSSNESFSLDYQSLPLATSEFSVCADVAGARVMGEADRVSGL